VVRRAQPKRIKSLVRKSLGPLEEQVMRAVCATGNCTVRDVTRSLGCSKIAYTTIMTTMDRLFRKGLLQRQTKSKAYVYSASLGWPQLETQLGRDLIAAFLSCRSAPPSQMAEALVEVLESFGSGLLAEVEDAIAAKRSKLGFEQWRASVITHSQSGTDVLPLGHA
jgi:predicted transcriptional regulator